MTTPAYYGPPLGGLAANNLIVDEWLMKASEPATPWLDSKGRLRLDARFTYREGKCYLTIRVKYMGTTGNGSWGLHVQYLMQEPRDKGDRALALRNAAEMASLQLGHPYRLRSARA